jgi:hypothetical protein
MDEAKGIVIPEKSGNMILGMIEDGFVRCIL